MKEDVGITRRRWAAATAAGLVVVAIVSLLFRTPTPPNMPPPLRMEIPDVALERLHDGNPALSQEAALADKAPLFLPTQWSARPNRLPPETLREPGGAFAYRIPEKFTFTTDMTEAIFPPPTKVPESPVDALEVGAPPQPFLGMGRTEPPAVILATRTAFVEAIAAGSGAPALSQPIKGVQLPSSADWEWLELIATVEPAGLVGVPTVVKSSGVEQIDAFFQQYLAKTFRIGERLTPGIYRIKIGP